LSLCVRKIVLLGHGTELCYPTVKEASPWALDTQVEVIIDTLTSTQSTEEESRCCFKWSCHLLLLQDEKIRQGYICISSSSLISRARPPVFPSPSTDFPYFFSEEEAGAICLSPRLQHQLHRREQGALVCCSRCRCEYILV